MRGDVAMQRLYIIYFYVLNNFLMSYDCNGYKNIK